MSGLISGLEFSINCDVSLQKSCKNCHVIQTLREDCNEHYHFTQCHGCKQT